MSVFSFIKEKHTQALFKKLDALEFHKSAEDWAKRTLYIHLVMLAGLTLTGALYFGHNFPTYVVATCGSAISSLIIVILMEQFAIKNLGALYSIWPGYRHSRTRLQALFNKMIPILQIRENQYKFINVLEKVVDNYDSEINTEQCDKLQQQLKKMRDEFKKGNVRDALIKSVSLLEAYSQQHYQCDMDDFSAKKEAQNDENEEASQEVEQEMGSSPFKF